jgi:hypothetical protein
MALLLVYTVLHAGCNYTGRYMPWGGPAHGLTPYFRCPDHVTCMAQACAGAADNRSPYPRSDAADHCSQPLVLGPHALHGFEVFHIATGNCRQGHQPADSTCTQVWRVSSLEARYLLGGKCRPQTTISRQIAS